MPVLNNARWERFAAFVAQGSTLDEAYKQAGYKENRHNAAALARRPDVKERITQISTQLTETAAKAEQITKEKIIEWHNEVREVGMKSGQLSAVNASIKEISVLTGHRIERTEIGGPGEFDHLTDDELEREVRERLVRLGFLTPDAAGDRRH